MAIRFSATRCLLLLAVAFFPRPLLAVPRFPGVIARDLGLDYEPPCSVCHLMNKTGTPTVTTPFGYALKARGFTEGDETLSTALSRLTADHTDSDGDGVDDVTELKNHTDPNSKTNASLTGVADPSFGCATTPGSGSAPGWGLAAVAVALGIMRRSKRAPVG
jgi:MYXO-CTERM domain-containing protein